LNGKPLLPLPPPALAKLAMRLRYNDPEGSVGLQSTFAALKFSIDFSILPSLEIIFLSFADFGAPN